MKPGDSIGGKYRLGRILGEGGMGSVWAATNELIGRDVAIKVMLPELAKNQDALQRFFKEARICASIRDPGIVDVLDLGMAEDGSPFIVMELLAGEPLENLMNRSRIVPVEQAVSIIRDVAQTLCLAHEKGVVHRDLKPANLFLQRAHKGVSQVKILDFGISKVMTDSNAYATRTGSVLGSPAYMSPEQAAGKPIDFRTDVYSLGVILYEALAGHIPFHECPNTNALLLAIATEDVPRLAQVAPHVPPFVAEVVERALRRKPLERYETIAEFAQALDSTQAQLMTVSASQPSVPVVSRAQPTDTAVSARYPADATNVTPAPSFQQQPAWGAPQSAHMPQASYQPQIQYAAQHGSAPHSVGPRRADAVTAAPMSRTNGGTPIARTRSGSSRALIGVGVVGGLAIGITLIAFAASKHGTPAAASASSEPEARTTTTAAGETGPSVVAASASASAQAASASPVASASAAPSARPVAKPGLPIVGHPLPPPTGKKRSPYDEF